MKRIATRSALALVIAVALVFGVDWGVWRVRVARGGGMGSVEVSWFRVAELKAGKEEYYPDGQGSTACSESVFPQGGARPCWWMEKHPVVFER